MNSYISNHFLTPMTYRNMGNSALKISSLGIGTWITFGDQIDDETSESIIKTAYEHGVNLFDVCESYADGKAECLLGNIFKKMAWKRSSYIVTTKIFLGGKSETEKGLSRKHIIEGTINSLARLQLSYVDIIMAKRNDSTTMPIEEIVRAFTYIIEQGYSFYWGTSKWSPTEIMEAYSVARQFNLIPPSCEQLEYNLFSREKLELYMPDLYQRIGIGSITHSPLASGLLSCKYEDGIPLYSRASLKGQEKMKEAILSDEGRTCQSKILSKFMAMATALECSAAQLAIAWCMRYEICNSVIMGVSSVDQLLENLGALKILPKLVDNQCDILDELDAVFGNRPCVRIPQTPRLSS